VGYKELKLIFFITAYDHSRDLGNFIVRKRKEISFRILVTSPFCFFCFFVFLF
jgi:hypothetical protein